MQEKKVKMSHSLSGMIEQMDAHQVGLVKGMFADYMEQYASLRAKHNAEAVSTAIHNSVSSMIDESIEESKEVVTCGRGCSFCCFQRVDISDDEATLILSYTKEIGFEINYDVLKKQAETKDEKEFNALTPIDRRCTFLNKDGECSIYEHRPSSCRKLIVMTEPAFCDTVNDAGKQIGKLVNLEAEVITASSLNVRESGSLAEMILKQKK
jgi:Fe-S-cluster containining protein